MLGYRRYQSLQQGTYFRVVSCDQWQVTHDRAHVRVVPATCLRERSESLGGGTTDLELKDPLFG